MCLQFIGDGDIISISNLDSENVDKINESNERDLLA